MVSLSRHLVVPFVTATVRAIRTDWMGESAGGRFKKMRFGKRPNTFQVDHGGRALTFGLEICGEHSAGQLAVRDGQTVDIQVVFSNSVTPKTEHMSFTRYGLFCDRYSGCSGVYDQAKAKIKPSQVVAANESFYWNVTL